MCTHWTNDNIFIYVIYSKMSFLNYRPFITISHLSLFLFPSFFFPPLPMVRHPFFVRSISMFSISFSFSFPHSLYIGLETNKAQNKLNMDSYNLESKIF